MNFFNLGILSNAIARFIVYNLRHDFVPRHSSYIITYEISL